MPKVNNASIGACGPEK